MNLQFKSLALLISIFYLSGCIFSATENTDSEASNLSSLKVITPETRAIVIPDDNDSCTFNGKIVLNAQSVDAFQNSSVAFGSQCVSEKRVCENGVLSGSFQFASCEIGQPASCLFNGQTVAHGSSVDAFQNSSVAFGSQCVSEKRVCENGVLSGPNYLFASCEVGQPASCLFNGKTIAHNAVIKTFSASAVKFGQICESENRTCTNGVLSGNFQFESCEVGAAAACTFNGQTVAHGQIVKSFQNSTVKFGLTCVEENRTCEDGILSGSFQFASCEVDAPASCLFNGQTVAHGQVVNAFSSSTVAYGSSCKSEQRTCDNGVLSGSNKYASCEVDAPASCLFNGQTVAHGQVVNAFSSSTVAYGSLCKSEQRTCDNGVLSGSHSYDSCIVENPASCKFNDSIIEHSKSVTAYESASVGYDAQCKSQVRNCDNGMLSGSYTQTNCKVQEKPKWVATQEWTACSADCGGQQTRIYKCLDSSGAEVLNSLCGARLPVASDSNDSSDIRLCDGNPSSVAKTIVSQTKEDAKSCSLCPSNQIGVIFKERDVIKTEIYACTNHEIKKVSDKTIYSAWREEKYCKDFVPYRCSQDSLTNTQADGRYKWLVKCQDSVPAIKEFLNNFDGSLGQVKGGAVKWEDRNKDKKDQRIAGQATLTSARRLYPTFIDGANNKPWIAPKDPQQSCSVPAKVYIAAVCVSSCATPDQEILVFSEKSKQFKSQTFLDALNSKTKFVGSLHLDQGNDDKGKIEIKKTKVENWVTELMDTEHEILVFKTKSGSQLKVTPNHPLVAADGTIKIAVDFVVGDQLVKLGGQFDEITSIDKIHYFGKVYNLFVNSNDKLKNIVVTNGFLNGTAFYQNEGSDQVNKKILRIRLLKDAFKK